MNKGIINYIFLILMFTAISLAGDLATNTPNHEKQKLEPISPQQLLENLEKESYCGKKVSIRAYNQDVNKVLKEISRVSGLVVKIPGDVRKKITLIQINTPWDQILSRVLKKADLQIIFEDDHLRIKKKSPKKILSKTPTKYTGEYGDFIFKDADLKNVILFFAKNYKLNIVMDPGISGRVTCRLIQVPWDQALDVILRRHGLAIVTIGKIYKIKKF